jgi:uncharacterized membrane protein
VSTTFHGRWRAGGSCVRDQRMSNPPGRGDSGSKIGLRWLLTIFMVAAGLNHFLSPAVYVGMMPRSLPWPQALVAISGLAEIVGGMGLILPATRRLAAWGLVVLFVAIFPANLNMALHHLPLGDKVVSPLALWLRLPLQLPLIAWAYWFTRPDRQSAARPAAPAPA